MSDESDHDFYAKILHDRIKDLEAENKKLRDIHYKNWRNEFAKAAMQGMLANPTLVLTDEQLIECSIDKADALLAEAKKREADHEDIT